ncbi:MAG: hypothetical protein PHQ23_02860 [Candidatus Wallbacteria bacterium]|nr:hypothetical protein [Candidatus Wallbacteria bacterium]
MRIIFLTLLIAVSAESADVPQFTELVFRVFLRENRIFDLLVSDDERQLYIATEEGMKVFEDGVLKRVYSKSDGLKSEVISFLTRDPEGKFLLGGSFSLADKSCLFRLAGETLTVWPEGKGVPSNVIKAVLFGRDMAVCCSFYQGLHVFDLTTGHFFPLNIGAVQGKYFVDMLEHNGYLYLAGKNDGLLRVLISKEALEQAVATGDPAAVAAVPIEIKELTEHTCRLLSNNTTCLAAVEEGLWIGTQGGANSYTIKENIWKNYWDAMDNNFVSSIFPDDPYIWIGTQGGLALRHQSQDKWWAFTMKNGLPSNVILRIRGSSNFVWMATEQGVVQVNKALFYRHLDESGK